MSVAVISCGRTGTNMVLEILRGNSSLKSSRYPENKSLCKKKKVYANNYLTKCDIHYFAYNKLVRTLNINPKMKVVWTIRDPRDIFLSKIIRGHIVSEDGTPDGALSSINKMKRYYSQIIKDFPDRVVTVKMEDVIKNTESETKRLCEFLDLPYEPKMINFVGRMRDEKKKKRYKTIDKSQLEMWKRVDEIHDGFFAKKDYIDEYFVKLKPLADYWKY